MIYIQGTMLWRGLNCLNQPRDNWTCHRGLSMLLIVQTRCTSFLALTQGRLGHTFRIPSHMMRMWSLTPLACWKLECLEYQWHITRLPYLSMKECQVLQANTWHPCTAKRDKLNMARPRQLQRFEGVSFQELHTYIILVLCRCHQLLHEG